MERLSTNSEPCTLHKSALCQVCKILGIYGTPGKQIRGAEDTSFRERYRICQNEKNVVVQAMRMIFEMHPTDISLVYQGIQEALSDLHRTVQQPMVSVFLFAIADLLAWQKGSGEYDIHNKESVCLGKALQALLEKHPLPFA
ncbi:hypothetical protein HQ520_04065 [bacterium]|nr:hypothetical protein [bacterium]